MAASQAAGTNIQEAGGQSSAMDVELFRARKNSMPYKWHRAVVDRYEGLTLFDDEQAFGLHFANAVCGYEGQGPYAAVDILEEAGFAKRDVLSERIFHETHVTLNR